jgi:hypothetical protein
MRVRFPNAAGVLVRSPPAGSPDAAPTKPVDNTAFESLKQIDAGLLNAGYAEAGAANGPPVILLHGRPYDIHSYADVTPCFPKMTQGTC